MTMNRHPKAVSNIDKALNPRGRPSIPGSVEEMKRLLKEQLGAVEKEPTREVRVIIPGEIIDPKDLNGGIGNQTKVDPKTDIAVDTCFTEIERNTPAQRPKRAGRPKQTLRRPLDGRCLASRLPLAGYGRGPHGAEGVSVRTPQGMMIGAVKPSNPCTFSPIDVPAGPRVYKKIAFL
jgi:hypothetical protein